VAGIGPTVDRSEDPEIHPTLQGKSIYEKSDFPLIDLKLY
jgi:hypothetical protein